MTPWTAPRDGPADDRSVDDSSAGGGSVDSDSAAEGRPDDRQAGDPSTDDSADAALLERRLVAVREAELEQAVRRLESTGDLTAEKRQAVERLAARLTARLVARPAVAAGNIDDERALATLVDLLADETGRELAVGRGRENE